MNQAKPLLIRADAGPRMGIGHVMRCLALAQAWQDAGGAAEFLTASDAPAVAARLCEEGIKVTQATAPAGSAADAAATASRARETNAAWVAVDGYQFDAAYQQSLKQAGLKVLWLDDYGHAGGYCADLVLNQNLHAEESLYTQRDADVRLLLGPQYALLRREFWKLRGWKREIPQQATKVVVTMGGSDRSNATGKVLEALRSADAPGLEACLVVGPANPLRGKLEADAAASGKNTRVVTAGRDMPELMAWADAAVAAAGITCWELMFLGLPSLLVVQSENQQRLGETLHERGMAVNLGWADPLLAGDIAQALTGLLGSQPMRVQMSQRGRQVVDGMGATRVVSVLHGGPVLRAAAEGDSRLLWEWANDPQVRAASLSTDPIPWEDHERWFWAKLRDPGCILYIALQADGTPLGQVRFEAVSEQDAEIDVSIAREKRRAGLGSALLELAAAQVFATSRWRSLHAFIRPENKASVRAFEQANFLLSGVEERKGHAVLHYVCTPGPAESR